VSIPAIAPAKWSKNGVNTYEYRNVRLAALWKPNDDFKAQLSYYYQRAAAGGFPYVATQSAAYNQWISPNTQLPGTNLIPQLYNSPVPGGAGRLFLGKPTAWRVRTTASTWWRWKRITTWASQPSRPPARGRVMTTRPTPTLTALYTNFYFYQNFYVRITRSFIQGHDRFDDKVWSQEFRLASKSGGTFDWVAGVFYKDQKTFIQEHEYYPGYDAFYANCPQTVAFRCPWRERLHVRTGRVHRFRCDQCCRYPPGSRSSLHRRFRNPVQRP